MRNVLIVAGALALLVSPPFGRGQAAGPSEEGAEAARSPQEQVVRDFDGAFVRDYNAGDSKALADHFTEDAEVYEADGERYQGREPIEQRFKETFAAHPGLKMSIETTHVHALGPDAVKEEGRTIVVPKNGEPVTRVYTALLVRRDGRWRIASVREELEPHVAPHAKLKPLEWMIGDWIDEGEEVDVHLHCEWSDDGNYLLREFTAHRAGRPVLQIHQRIGWDPLAEQIRSWAFHSDGSFSEAHWARDGDRWLIKHKGYAPEGAATSSTNVMWRERPDLARWTSSDRVEGGEAIPGAQSFVLVRVPPPPRTQTRGPRSPSNTNGVGNDNTNAKTPGNTTRTNTEGGPK